MDAHHKLKFHHFGFLANGHDCYRFKWTVSTSHRTAYGLHELTNFMVPPAMKIVSIVFPSTLNNELWYRISNFFAQKFSEHRILYSTRSSVCILQWSMLSVVWSINNNDAVKWIPSIDKTIAYDFSCWKTGVESLLFGSILVVSFNYLLGLVETGIFM